MRELHEACRAGVARVLRAALGDTGTVHVYEKLVANDKNVKYPLALCSIAGMPEERERISFAERLWSFPVLVLFARRGDPADDRETGPYLAMRDRGAKALDDVIEMPEVPGFFDCHVEHQQSITSMARGRTEPGQTGDPLGPAWLKVAGSVVAWVDVIRPGM
jgi:hypothetical protein